MTTQASPDEIVARAQALIDQVRQQLDDADDIFRRQGLDPQKAHGVIAALTTPDILAKARAAFEEDQREIEQEVSEGMARLALDAADASTATASRRPRTMI